jgi:signal transduction histidine kinase
VDQSQPWLVGKFIHKINHHVGLMRSSIFLFRFSNKDLLENNDNLNNLINELERDAASIADLGKEFRAAIESPDKKRSISINDFIFLAVEQSNITKNIETKIDITEGDRIINSTENLLEVLKNLIINSCEAMPDGGHLEINVKIKSSEDRIEIIVIDSGRGIPDLVKRVIFKPYFSTKEESGHGLGLWWSKAYIESLGGELKLLSSEVGLGSSFMISLPLPN